MSHLVFMLFAFFDYMTPVWAESLSCSPQTKCLEKLNLKSSESSLTVLINGQGSISDSEFFCETECTQAYSQGATVTLTATPTVGYLFTEWGGDCQGVTHETTISLEGQKTCIAQFIPQDCQTAIYSPTETKLHIPFFAVEIYFPLTDIPNGDYALCTGKGENQVALKYQRKEEAFLFSQEIVCANQLVKLPPQSSCPLYSAKQRTLELPNLQVTSEVLLPGGKKLNVGKCYQAQLTQGVKPPHGINRPPTVVNSRLFTLVHVKEQNLCE